MNIPIELAVVVMIIVFLLVIMVIGVEHTIPMYVRSNFDDICNNYLAIIERDGGLTAAQKDALKTELNRLGITNVTINAPGSGTWGQHVTLRVEGEYVFETTQYDDFSKIQETRPIHYENSTVILCLE